MAKKRKTKKVRLGWKALAVIAVLLVVAYLCYLFVPPVKTAVDKFLYADPSETPSVEPSTFVGAAENDLAVHFIDVGQGDCILIELPDGKHMLIDAGDRNTEYKAAVKEYIQGLEIEILDYVVVTHFDSDHIGGMADVFSYTEVKKVYLPEIDDGKITTQVYQKLMQAIADENSEIVYNEMGLELLSSDAENQYRFTWLSPEAEQYSAVNDKNNPSSLALNDVSPLMLLEYQGKKIVFTGDANVPIEKQVITNYQNGLYGSLDLRNIDLLKAGHHGSNGTGTSAQKTSGSTCREFLDLLKPKSVVISVGEGNHHGHPHAETIDRIAAANAALYRTDEDGNVVATVKADASLPLEITVEKTEEPTPTSAPAAGNGLPAFAIGSRILPAPAFTELFCALPKNSWSAVAA